MKASKVLIFAAFFYGSVSEAHDLNFYKVHPKLLQEVIKACPAKNPPDVSCEQLKNAALRINELSYQLRSDPQGYGKKILSLQEHVNDLNDNKQELQEYLAIVKWLESPEGA